MGGIPRFGRKSRGVLKKILGVMLRPKLFSIFGIISQLYVQRIAMLLS